jgi:hypothetical protein
MAVVDVCDFSSAGWAAGEESPDARARWYCERLEEGEILAFGRTPFSISADDRAFLLDVRQAGSSYLKNISYRPRDDRVRGLARGSGDTERLRSTMRRYSAAVTGFAVEFLRPYAQRLQIDFASFRSVEEQGRRLPLKARNDLLHVDAFPARPVHGQRILRVFTNVHPTQPRVWITTDTFEVLAGRFAEAAGLHAIARKEASLPYRVGRALRRLGIPVVDRSPYDEFMLRFHDYLKGDADFQARCPKSTWTFPPGATWIALTDMVPHAVKSGQFALEQTFIVPSDALLRPEKAPLRVAERLSGGSLTP